MEIGESAVWLIVTVKTDEGFERKIKNNKRTLEENKEGWRYRARLMACKY